MASLKRKASFEQEDVDKKQRIMENDVQKLFSLGSNLFASCNVFKNTVLIHIRRYKNFGDKYYPTKEGITLSPNQLSALMDCEYLKRMEIKQENPGDEFFLDVPFKPRDDPVCIYTETCVGIKDLDRDTEIEIHFSDAAITLKREITCKSGKTYSTMVAVDKEQWETLFIIGHMILTYGLQEQYRNVSFKQSFEFVAGCSAPNNIPEGAPMEEVQDTLNYMIKSSFFDAIALNSELANPLETVDESVLSTNTIKNFNTSIKDLKIYYIAEAFYKKVCDFPIKPVPNHTLLNFVTIEFLDSISIPHMIDMAREQFCKFVM